MFSSSHFEIHVRDLEAARRFYVDQLRLPVLQDTPPIRLLAVRAGNVRLSIFGDRGEDSGSAAARIILATGDLDNALRQLASRGLRPDGPPDEAPGFLRFATFRDPDGNPVEVAQYLRDPLTPI